MAVYWGEKPESVPTYLPSLLILANGTGRRISAICSLKFADLRPSLGPGAVSRSLSEVGHSATGNTSSRKL